MKRLLRAAVALLGAGVGCGIVALILYNVRYPGYSYVMRYTTDTAVMIGIYIAVGLLSGIIFFIFAPRIIDGVRAWARRVDNHFRSMPALDILFGIAGLILGLLVAYLASRLFLSLRIPALSTILAVALYVLCGLFGYRFGISRRSELMHGGPAAGGARPKVLDTSVIIDGRLLDVCRTGFVEGELIVPEFVLRELRHIADSSDATRRNRGRRGLDIIRTMQEELGARVRIDGTDFAEVAEVDLKLLRLAEHLGGVLVTNDYNLNKVAAVQNTPVLNINELAGAVKPVLLPGEELELTILREGKEQGQGVGFLEDGTMVIVDGGKRFIGEQVELQVTSSLQTSAGRMIFARLRGKANVV